MSEPFSAAEVAAIRKFFAWIEEEGWLSYNSEGIVGADDDGITCAAFNAADDYGGASLERDETVIPWLALTNPAAHRAEVEAEEAARRREEALREVQHRRQREEQERAVYEALKAKFG